MDRYEIYNKINELLYVAVNNLYQHDVNWLIDNLIADLEFLRED